ncbi:MAG: crosslink repair DNA glycosylase YcaQ family protein [Candidatus Wallbacteria bacterium]|nr:crosslink repair DNA glycosylase YcaQ family protein [Candidatus Wallbacteria bacterium]
MQKFTLEQARSIALQAQFLSGEKLSAGKKGMLETLDRIGYVQIDTISVISRAHHLTFWSRVPRYNEELLDDLTRKEKKIFEYWGHAASYLPISDFRFYLPMMKSYATRSAWAREWVRKYGHLLEPVLQRVREEGPLSSKDFDSDRKRGTWWDWKPAKVALEVLYWQGRLVVAGRTGFQKIYDLPERFLPRDLELSPPTEKEMGEFFIRRALQAYGIATESEIINHIHAAGKALLRKSLTKMVSGKKVLKVKVSGLDKIEYFMLPSTEKCSKENSADNLYLLNPFDNFVIQRDRLRKLFDFDYTIECYVPPPKRKFGYYCLPILWKNRLVGRLDPKADRAKKQFVVKNLVFEPWFSEFREISRPLDSELRKLAKFCSCTELEFGKFSILIFNKAI